MQAGKEKYKTQGDFFNVMGGRNSSVAINENWFTQLNKKIGISCGITAPTSIQYRIFIIRGRAIES